MNMNPIATEQLTDVFAFQQQQLAEIILQSSRPDIIFRLGATVCHCKSESIFNTSSTGSRHISDIVLLVLIRDLQNKQVHEWQDKIEAHCRSVLPVTCMVLQSSTFESWLKTGDYFAVRVWQSAARIYDSGELRLDVPQSATIIITDKDTARQHAEGLAKAKEFLAGAELYQLRKQYAMAAFMLHQAAEQSLRTLLKTGTGFCANIHSIERLLRYAVLVTDQLRDIFPQQTDQDKRLLHLLQKAYVGGRYDEGFRIGHVEAGALMERVGRLVEVLE